MIRAWVRFRSLAVVRGRVDVRVETSKNYMVRIRARFGFGDGLGVGFSWEWVREGLWYKATPDANLAGNEI